MMPLVKHGCPLICTYLYSTAPVYFPSISTRINALTTPFKRVENAPFKRVETASAKSVGMRFLPFKRVEW